MLSIFSKPQLAEIIKNLSDSIPQAMGNDLVSMIQYGANGQELNLESPDRQPSEPIRILIVLEKVGAQTLDQLSSVYRKIPGNKRITPMVMSLEEIHSSTDVFPITFLEMKQNYRVLTGADVLVDLPIGFGHLRLRCEQELKNLLLRMQNRYLTQHDDRRLKYTFRANFRSFVRTLGAALLLVENSCPNSHEQVIRQAAETFSLNQSMANRILDVYSGNDHFPLESVRAIYAALMELVSAAAVAVDQIPEYVALVEMIDEAGGLP